MLDFRDHIISNTPAEISSELWEAYRNAKSDPFKRQIKYIEKDKEFNGEFKPHVNLELMEDFTRCYKAMESARNSGVSKIGTLCNQMVKHTYQLLGLRVITEHKLVQNSSRRAIDVFLPDLATYVSVTTTPRERKRGDWQHELDQLIQLSKMGHIKNWQFVGLMFEGTAKEPKRIEDELRQASLNAKVVMVKDVKSHANFLLDLCQRNQSLQETMLTSSLKSPSFTRPATQKSLI